MHHNHSLGSGEDRITGGGRLARQLGNHIGGQYHETHARRRDLDGRARRAVLHVKLAATVSLSLQYSIVRLLQYHRVPIVCRDTVDRQSHPVFLSLLLFSTLDRVSTVSLSSSRGDLYHFCTLQLYGPTPAQCFVRCQTCPDWILALYHRRRRAHRRHQSRYLKCTIF